MRARLFVSQRWDSPNGVPSWIGWLTRKSFWTEDQIKQLWRFVIMSHEENQKKIDEYGAELTDIFDNLSDAITKLKEQVANGEVLNFGALETQIERGKSLEAPVVVPVVDTPTESTPPADDSGSTASSEDNS